MTEDRQEIGDGIRLRKLLSIPSFEADLFWPGIPILLVLGDEEGFAETGIIRPPGASCSSTGLLDLGAEIATCPVSLDALVVPISSKRDPENRRPIRLGRSWGMDVCLNHPTISKFHAQFLPPEEGRRGWRLRDCGSRNGTWVEGVHMPPDEIYRVRAFSDLTFGSVHCRFLQSGSLTALVHMISETQDELSASDTHPDVEGPEDDENETNAVLTESSSDLTSPTETW